MYPDPEVLVAEPGLDGLRPAGGFPTRGLPAGFVAGADGVGAVTVTGAAAVTLEGLGGTVAVDDIFAAVVIDVFSGGGVDVSGVEVPDSALEVYALDVYALVSVADAEDPDDA